ncbi:MAG: DUF58 domain-containing protein [Gemmatimonadales bacterium]|nr:DUF58 domain-containing protein [Gemmatimonadales bacterium]NIN48795.1 DUF58 domain-containing protein [Gemmatimonadales bacterium]NIP06259.1 DUF58 domain-containing protein [Gemmatimonadales bacterium]NIR00146.1 DUF58 domain-containing protein [Gemmatimonadales bacterium]NIS64549.1 DUF58 domain-containing protein [Gemmatimonadales bacterium]
MTLSSPSRLIGADVLRQVKTIELRTRRLVNTLFSGEYRSVFRGQGMEFAEVRAYQHGDDYRSIDWNVSARMASPYVKIFEEERELTLLLVVDRSGSEEFGNPVAKAERGVEVAAVLALAAARQNDRAGALIFSGRIDHVVPPRKGRRHALRIIRDLVAFRPSDQRTNIAAALAYAARLLRHRSIVVILSDFRAPGWEEPLRRLARRHEVVAVTVDDPREFELPAAGWIELRDAESGQRMLVDTSHDATRLAVTMAAEKVRLARARAIKHAQVDHIALRTDKPYAEALHRAFAERARRLKR